MASNFDDDEYGPDLVCPECGLDAAPKTGEPWTERGLNLHRVHKHGHKTTPGAKAERQPKPPTAVANRRQKVQSSLAVFGIGAGMINARDGAILAQYIPQMATALDEGAKHYEWCDKLCNMLEDAGPMSLMASAFLPPLILILANHGLIPQAVAPMVTVLGGPPPQPRPRQEEAPGGPTNGSNPPLHPWDVPVTNDDLAHKGMPPEMTGPSVVNVADGRP